MIFFFFSFVSFSFPFSSVSCSAFALSAFALSSDAIIFFVSSVKRERIAPRAYSFIRHTRLDRRHVRPQDGYRPRRRGNGARRHPRHARRRERRPRRPYRQLLPPRQRRACQSGILHRTACLLRMDRFPEGFMFQLSVSEFANLKSQIATSSWGGVRKPPKVFTECPIVPSSLTV